MLIGSSSSYCYPQSGLQTFFVAYSQTRIIFCTSSLATTQHRLQFPLPASESDFIALVNYLKAELVSTFLMLKPTRALRESQTNKENKCHIIGPNYFIVEAFTRSFDGTKIG